MRCSVHVAVMNGVCIGASIVFGGERLSPIIPSEILLGIQKRLASDRTSAPGQARVSLTTSVGTVGSHDMCVHRKESIPRGVK